MSRADFVVRLVQLASFDPTLVLDLKVVKLDADEKLEIRFGTFGGVVLLLQLDELFDEFRVAVAGQLIRNRVPLYMCSFGQQIRRHR